MFRPLCMICYIDSLRIHTLQLLPTAHVSEYGNYNGTTSSCCAAIEKPPHIYAQER